MSVLTRETPSQAPIVVQGRVLEPAAYRPSTFVDLEDTPEWWKALVLLGVLLVLAGVLVRAGAGELEAVLGVGLFFGTAVLAGRDRVELATAVGSAAVVATALGISVVLGTDPWVYETFLGFAILGAVLTLAGVLGLARSPQRRSERG